MPLFGWILETQVAWQTVEDSSWHHASIFHSPTAADKASKLLQTRQVLKER
jgi:hypothetical protein